MDNEILVSIIVPVYNVSKYLKRCVDSIINQNYKKIEIVLVDDGSTDSSGQICDRYANEQNNILAFHIKNSGLSAARNYGVAACHGDMVAFIDSDDYVTSDYVKDMMSLVITDNCDLVISSHRIVYSSGREKIVGDYSRGIIDKDRLFEKIFYGEIFDISSWGKLFSRKLFKNVQFPVNRLFEDSATTYKFILESKKIGYNLVPNYYYMIRPNSITTKNFNINKMDLILFNKEMCDVAVSKFPNLKKASLSRMTYVRLNTLSNLVSSQHPDKELLRKLSYNTLLNYNIVIRDQRSPKKNKMSLFILKHFKIFGFYISYQIYDKFCNR